MKYVRTLLAASLLLVAFPSGAAVRRCTPSTKQHDLDRHADRKGHGLVCPTLAISQVEVSKTGGLGQIDVHGRFAAVVQRDEGMVAIVDTRRMKVVGRYEDEVQESLDGDVAFSDDGNWIFYARQTSNFDEDGVHVLNVEDKKAPTLSQYQPAGGAFRIEYYKDDAGEWVILLDAIEGLVVYRFVPETGTIVKVFQDAAPALKVGGPASAGLHISKKDPMTESPLLYVTTGRTGLQVYDLSDPAAIQIVGEWNEVGLAAVDVRVTAKARTVYAATEYWFTKTLPPEVVVLDATKLDAIEQTGKKGLRLPAEDTWRVQGIDVTRRGLDVAYSHAGLVRFTGSRITRAVSWNAAPNEQAGYRASPYAMDVFTYGATFLSDASTGILLKIEPVPEPNF